MHTSSKYHCNILQAFGYKSASDISTSHPMADAYNSGAKFVHANVGRHVDNSKNPN